MFFAVDLGLIIEVTCIYYLWFDTTQFYTSLFTYYMQHFSQIAPRVCTLMLFIFLMFYIIYII